MNPLRNEAVTLPPWLCGMLRVETPVRGQFRAGNVDFVVQDGIARAVETVSEKQDQTKDVFSYKWRQRNTFESEQMRAHARHWLNERYGPAREHDFLSRTSVPVLFDAGCGAGYSALEYFGDLLHRLHYVGVDVSNAVDVAATRFGERRIESAGFLQADITRLPFSRESVDVVFSEGVMHHTDSTEKTLKYLASLIRPGGHFMFYVYKKKGPVREFTDDHVRERLQTLSPEQAWEMMMPLTKLGKALGDLNVEFDVPEDIELLEIRAGRTDLQRFFYWNVLKAFYRPELTLEEMNHINFDWYAPANAHRQSPADVRSWCADASLHIVREVIEDAGITIVARKA